jgi:hypothetical protein
MADTSGSWFSNVLDAASFSCILVAIEEYGRSIAQAGKTMPPKAQLGFLLVGIAFSFLGKKGARIWHWLRGWVTQKALKEENAQLRAELRQLKEATKSPGVAPETLALLKDAPAIRVEYFAGTEATAGKLILKNDRDSPAIIRQFGKLISREQYASEYALTIIPAVPPQVEKGNPVECKMYGVVSSGATSTSLEALIQSGTENTIDVISIDYDDCDGNQFSRLFLLTRNADGSIVFVPEPIALRGQIEPHAPKAQDLSVLRHELGLSKYLQRRAAEVRGSAPKDLTRAGRLLQLADEAGAVFDFLDRMRTEAKSMGDTAALACFDYPLSGSFFEVMSKTDPWEWYLKSLWRFQALYMEHRKRAFNSDLPFKSGVLKNIVPNDEVDCGLLVEMISEHQRLLIQCAEDLRRPYVS